ncbi:MULTISPECIES: regulatory protein RecX [unclassified Sphingomonas]|uniref:regulatory protein RecX n=1 Tax=unclassified Sphingomonas TaxID=196159 RepID=UPI001D118E9B|nr:MULTISPECIES: RecX family transcriptional regulator [unclassified Sphingomonas]MCC2980109.1 RecX family transcriptional regulator [Sphingomonas sp. IC4-52]MCD2314860.1 RecX family transcriptional regulator [Sphingomonas sp. IC-11]
MTNSRRPPPPLDAAKLEALALRYVERFATTRGKLASYLARKVRERGWSGAAVDPSMLAERMAELGYINDGLFAEARARSLTRRGYGVRRVSQALRAAHVEEEDAAPALEQSADEALLSALALARRRRFGPYAQAPADERTRERQMATMLRAGHSFAVARRIVSAAPGDVPEPDQ